MAIEASIVEQLQELRKWQLQQQEALIRQQQEQREKLSDKQNRMYQALSMSVDEMSLTDDTLKEIIDGNHQDKKEKEGNLIDFDMSDNECHTPVSRRNHSFSHCFDSSVESNSNKNLNLKPPQIHLAVRSSKTDTKPNVELNDSHNQYNYSSDFSIDESIKSQRHITLDDIPVPSPKKDFNALLEERLKDSEAVLNVQTKGRPVVKKPFLKKGQGLARFMPHTTSERMSRSTIRPRSASFTTGTQSSNAKQNKINIIEKSNSIAKLKKSDDLKKIAKNVAHVAQQKLTLKNVPPPRKKGRSKSIGALPTAIRNEQNLSAEIISDANSSDLEVKNKKELEEVRIFELLEDKAENSSFCSTSSTVIAFLQQSTPLKQKALLHSALKNKISLNDIGNETIEEIVRTVKSNQLPFAQMQKDTKTQNLSQWDAASPSKLKSNIVVAKTILPYGTDVDENYDDYTPNHEQSQDDNQTSLHVRFSEYNEYKTMTDTSSTSSDSQTIVNYINDNGVWSDSQDSSDVDSIISSMKANGQCSNNQKIDSYGYSKKDEDGDEASDYNESEDYKRDDETEDYKHDDETEDYKHDDETEDYKNENQNEDNETADGNDEDSNLKNITIQKDDTIIEEKNPNSLFKSELLKTRLLELEQEIEIFRKESAALSLQRQKLQEERSKLQEDRIILQRGFKEKEEALEMEKRKTESIVQEEKKRLAREKAALESRMKDAWEKAQKSKQERQEIQTLREQLEELREEMAQKESKWAATNARQRSQMRVLQTENSQLKQELEKLQQKKNAKFKRPQTSSNTRAIHQINKFLADRKQVSPFKKEDPVSDKAKSPSIAETNYKVNSETPEEKQEEKVEKKKVLKSVESIARTRNLYENLLREATDCFTEVQVERRNLMNRPVETQDHALDCSNINENICNEDSATDNRNWSHASPRTDREGLDNHQGDNESEHQTIRNNKQGIREVHHPDGRTEFWYPNGNVKKLFPDKQLTKMIYYNGDVRETDKNGTVKYFYAATRTWHTTRPDGLEILEFPDGQVERRSNDGTIEVSFPDGSVRSVLVDGSERWVLRDGTIAETSADGEKVLTLPNGQKEIHTKDHKRREYPDGTVKLVYLDGTQETRYANGRIRLKDKEGNLIMDTHQ